MILKDKVALVTGAGRGIGRAISLKLAEAGATIALNDIIPENIHAVAREIEKAGGKAVAYPSDISQIDEVERMVNMILEDLKTINILVNNAGITRDNLLLRMKEEEWESVLKVNLTGAFNVTKVVAKTMIKQREGKIVNISSVIGLVGNAGQANYAASKAGLIGFTKSISKELASRNINVNAIAPGYIQTEMTEKLPEKVKAELIQRIPLGYLGNPEDVAQVVLFLVSSASRYITGQVINVDGGMVM